MDSFTLEFIILEPYSQLVKYWSFGIIGQVGRHPKASVYEGLGKSSLRRILFTFNFSILCGEKTVQSGWVYG